MNQIEALSCLSVFLSETYIYVLAHYHFIFTKKQNKTKKSQAKNHTHTQKHSNGPPWYSKISWKIPIWKAEFQDNKKWSHAA